jgi:hypothetical protein
MSPQLGTFGAWFNPSYDDDTRVRFVAEAEARTATRRDHPADGQRNAQVTVGWVKEQAMGESTATPLLTLPRREGRRWSQAVLHRNAGVRLFCTEMLESGCSAQK